jgi:diguanylate cyclase (GGDEF)-like protein
MLQSFHVNAGLFRSRRTALAQSLQTLPVRMTRALPGPGNLVNLLRRAIPRARTELDSDVLHSLEEQIAVLDAQGVIMMVNRAWRRFAERNGLCTQQDWRGVSYLEVLSAAAASGDESAAEAERGMLGVIRGEQESFYYEYPCHSPEEQRWFLMRFTRLHGHPDRFVVSHHDITLRKQAEEKAEAMALHDELTGLANRRYFNLFFQQEMRRGMREGRPVSLVVLDVDHFKQYNDQYGHIAGDQCLADIGRLLARFARRPGDLAVRMGGDEFALILGDTGTSESEQIAWALLDAVRKYNDDAERTPTLAVSVGAATAVPDDSFSEDALISEADRAMYYAKRTGRNRFHHAQHQLDQQA